MGQGVIGFGSMILNGAPYLPYDMSRGSLGAPDLEKYPM